MTWTAGAPRGTAISGSRPAGQPAGQDGSPARPRRRAGGSRPVLSRLAQWPNWRLPVKLALVMTIPVIASLVLGSVVVSGQLGNYQSYQRANQIIQLTGSTGRAPAGRRRAQHAAGHQ